MKSLAHILKSLASIRYTVKNLLAFAEEILEFWVFHGKLTCWFSFYEDFFLKALLAFALNETNWD